MYSNCGWRKIISEGIQLHGLPSSIVYNCDGTFSSTYCKALFKLQGTSFSYSSFYHPQTNKQMEALNRILEQ